MRTETKTPDLQSKADAAYKELGGIGNKHARLIRGLSEMLASLQSELAAVKKERDKANEAANYFKNEADDAFQSLAEARSERDALKAKLEHVCDLCDAQSAALKAAKEGA
jgi:uncharacterized coiled-coil DUF342 family protein